MDFPEPLCPKIATKSPSLMSIFTLSRAFMVSSIDLPSFSVVILYSKVKFYDFIIILTAEAFLRLINI